MNIPQKDLMSFDNQTKLIPRMTSCWNFFVDEYPEYVSENVFKSKSIRVNPVKRKDRRSEFTEDDLHLIFNPKTYLPAIFDIPSGRKILFNTQIILFLSLEFSKVVVWNKFA